MRKLAVVAVFIAALAVAAPAGAVYRTSVVRSGDVRQTLDRAGPVISRDEAAVKAAIAAYPDRTLAPALGREVRDLRALRARLVREHAGADIVQGLGMIASATAHLRRDVQRAHGGPVPKAEVSADVRLDKRGRKHLLVGLHELNSRRKGVN